MFQISGISNAPAGQAAQALLTNFKAILSTVGFQPADAIDS
jgi:hypothetical protein